MSKDFPFFLQRPEIDEMGHELMKAHYRLLEDFEACELPTGCIIHIYDLASKKFSTGKVHSFQYKENLNYQATYSENGWEGMTCMSARLARCLIKVVA